MTQDDVLFGYRLQLFALAAERGVSQACRLMGVHRSTYYRWKAQVDRQGLEMLRPRERRRPQMPNQFSVMVEQRIVAFCLGHPGHGPRRIASRLARPEWGGLSVSPNGVYKTLVRHGLNTRAKRLALVAGYRAPWEPPRDPAARAAHRQRPAGRAGRHRLLFRRAPARGQGPGLADHRDRHLQQLCVGRPRRHTSGRTDRRADLSPGPPRRRELQQAGWHLERVLSDNGNEFGRQAFAARLPDGVCHTQIRSGRPQTNGHVERLHRTILEECWRPAFARYLQVRFTGLRRDLAHYLHEYNFDREHHGRITQGRRPADLVYGAHKMEPR